MLIICLMLRQINNYCFCFYFFGFSREYVGHSKQTLFSFYCRIFTAQAAVLTVAKRLSKTGLC